MRRHGVAPSRALGQNFVVDANTVRRIARLADIGPGSRVLEIGPGLGSLTLALLETGAQVDAIEIDRHLLEPLAEVLAGTGARVHHADALSADYAAILGDARDVIVVANLPYNVATPVVLHLLETVPQVSRLLVMVQREVAERLAAMPGDDAYGIPSIRLAYFADAAIVGKVPATVFSPRPKVESALVAITRLPRTRILASEVDESALFDVVREAFAHRRKMLRRSLSAWADESTFERARVAGTARPEELGLEEFARLAAAK